MASPRHRDQGHYYVDYGFGKKRNKKPEYTASFTDESGNTRTLSLNKIDERKLRTAKTEEERSQFLMQMSRKMEYR